MSRDRGRLVPGPGTAQGWFLALKNGLFGCGYRFYFRHRASAAETIAQIFSGLRPPSAKGHLNRAASVRRAPSKAGLPRSHPLRRAQWLAALAARARYGFRAKGLGTTHAVRLNNDAGFGLEERKHARKQIRLANTLRANADNSGRLE